MRLRNIPRAEGVLNDCKEVVKNETEYKGIWQKVFGNTNPIHIEIGMGKGQFLLALARRNPQINYIGIERYSSVLLRAVEKLQAMDTGSNYDEVSATDDSVGETTHILGVPDNLRFICMDARDIADVFAPGEVARIYLNFSDPWPKARHTKRRLTSREFFQRYDKILTPDGTVEFKTDNRPLFDFSVEELRDSDIFEIMACTYDLHNDTDMNQGNIMTEYEEKFSSLGNPICKLIARRKR